MLCLTIVNRKKNAALSAKLMIWLVSNIFGGFPSDLGSTRTKPITPQKNATQGDFWFHRAGHRAAWPRARGCLVHERLTVGQCSWETPNTSQKKKNVFPISIFWSHRLKFWPNWSVSAASQSHGEAPWPRHLLSMLPYAVCKGSSTCSWDAKIGAAGVLCCRIRARSAVGLGGLVASWHRFTVGRIGRPVGCSKGMFEGVKQIDPWFIHLELGSIRMWSGCDSHSNGVPCLLVFRVSCWLHHLVDCCSPFFNWCLIVIWVIIIPIVSWQHAHITSNCAPKNCHLESKSPIPKLSDLYSGKVLTYTL